MSKKIFQVTGLPRSGSTLLMNILAQNPECHVTATSGILEVLLRIRNQWDEIREFKAMDHDESDASKERVLQGLYHGYFSNAEQPVVFDKSRGWSGYPEFCENILGEKPRMICCVRDLREVNASVEKLWRKTTRIRQTSMELGAFLQAKTALGRLDVLNGPGGMVGICVNQIKDMATRGYRDSLHFVDYDELTHKPQKTLREIYEYLEMEDFVHNFEHVEQVTKEDDFVHMFLDLHKIRPKVEPQDKTFEKVFDDTVKNPKPGEPAVWQMICQMATFWTSLPRY